MPKSAKKKNSESYYFLAVVFIALAILLAMRTYAWGPEGHRVVGQIAENHLTAATRKKLRSIMNEESLARAATWPDEIRSDESRDDQHVLPFWHFVTIPDNRNYDMSRKNPQGDAVFAINKMIATLKDKKASIPAKQFAIRWLTHLIGDIHQPLHIGNEKDRGGNLCRVKWGKKLTNLHAIIDDEVIDSWGLSYTELAAFLDTKDTQKIAALQKGDLLNWISESQRLRNEFYRDKNLAVTDDRSFCGVDGINNEIPEARALDFSSDKSRYRYGFLVRPIIEQRLREAGMRLAKILNQTL